MKFGFTIPTEPDPQDREPLRHTFEVCARAESLGFDFGVVSHHRFTTGYPLSPWVALGAIAARTSTLRLGTSIMLLPLDHPLDVAEEVATVDQISGGRVFLGAGLGYRRYEYDALELPYHRRGSRMSECLEIVQKAWTEDRFSYHGEHFDFDDVSVVPKPIQDPRPRIWLGANSDAGVARAARLADGWMAGFADRLDALSPRVDSYRQQAADAGREATVCLMRLIGVARRRADIEQAWLPAVVEMMRGYRRAGAPGERNETAAKSLGERREATLDSFEGMLVGGTPDDCIEALRRCEQATGCESLLATFRGPDAAAHLELFGREVVPAFS
jgi:probable F420-dependent oxidoreductase